MNFLTRLKIGQRLGLGFTMVLVLTVAIGLFALSRISRTNNATTDLATNWLVAMRALGEYQFELTRERRAEALYVMSDRRELYEEQVKHIQTTRQAAAQAWKRYADTVTEGDEQKLAQNIQQAQQRYEASLAQVLATPRGQPGFFEAARAKFIDASGADFDALAAAVSADIAFQTRGGDAAYKDSQDAFSQARLMIFALLIGAISSGAALAWFITRSITRPIARAVQVAETVAAGDLSSDVRADGTDETAQLLAALKRMNDGLVTIVSQVLHSSDSIATGSSQIASGNADLSQRTEEQASNLQQTAASMEQLTATVKQNADTARQATQLANHASAAAADGGRVVGEVVSTMHEITESSRRIADIIGVIDGIAFQTNILALNAAVEAARAGEQGRGFAVVASEVRALARRSADAAKEIKTLIGHSVDKVEDGSRLVDEAGQSIGNIVAQVQRVSDLVSEISAASVEQSTGIGQIGDAVSQLDQVTQQNAALVEESAAAADSLKQQAAQLTEVVSAFRLGA